MSLANTLKLKQAKTSQKVLIYKRAFDLLFSSAVLLGGSFLFIIIAILIKLTSKGPVFYSSQRVGLEGKRITCWKFRTMCVDAEKKLQELLANEPALKSEWGQYYKLKNDPRITWVGKWLRKSSLDELPQFWNVLKGTLSVVGPRPFLFEEIEPYFGSKIDKILKTKPGITGIWQTSGRNQLPFHARIALDSLYFERQSLLFDLYLILKTIPVILFQKGAY